MKNELFVEIKDTLLNLNNVTYIEKYANNGNDNFQISVCFVGESYTNFEYATDKRQRDLDYCKIKDIFQNYNAT